MPEGTVPARTLERLRVLTAQAQQGEAARQAADDLITAVAEAAGHDVAALALTALDLGTGRYVLSPRTGAPPAEAAPEPDWAADHAVANGAAARA